MNRSIILLPAFLLVALLLTVLYALLGFRGPEAVLREARQALDRNQFERSIRLLNTAEAALADSDAGLLEQALRMRAMAYAGLGLRKKALEDLRFLFDKLDVRDRDLMCIRIRTLNDIAAEGADEHALRQGWELADEWLARNGRDALILAEAGVNKALQARQALGRWLESVDSQTPPAAQPAVHRLAGIAAYGAAGDRILANRLQTLAAAVEARITGSTENTIDTITSIRGTAMQAREFFLRSLAGDEVVPTAYRGLVELLRAAGEEDTLLMVAQAYAARARPIDRLPAAVDIADTHLRHGRMAAVIQTANQFLPLGSLRTRYLAHQLDHAALRLIACRALAIRALDDRAQRQRLLADYTALCHGNDREVVEALDMIPMLHFLYGMLLDDPGQQRAHLVNFVRSPQVRDYPWNRRLLLHHAYRQLAEVCQESEKAIVLQDWIQAVPDRTEPVHAFARFQIGKRAGDLAMTALGRAMQSLPDKDTTLELMVEAQQAVFGRELDPVIQRSAALSPGIPDELGPYPALGLAAARRALALGHPAVALACCQRVRTNYPDTRLPVYLEGEILLAMGDPRRAARLTQQLLAEDPNDGRALTQLLAARQAQGLAVDDLRFESLMRGTPDLESTRFLARRWLDRREYQRVQLLTQQANARLGVDLELLVLGTRALMLDPATDPRRILTMLRVAYQVAQTADGSPRERRLALWALRQYILRNPENVPRHLRATLLDRFLRDNQSAVDLAELAAELAEADEPELAFRAYTDLVSEDRYADHRDGRHFLAAGRLALRVGNRPRARTLLSAALGFQGGAAADLDLAVLARLQGETPSPTRPLPVDSIRACCITGDRPAAVRYLGSRLTGNPLDISAQCLLAVFEPDAPVAQRVKDLAKAVGDDLILPIALIQDETFAKDAVKRLEELAAKHPKDDVLAVLLARAYANANQHPQVHPLLGRARQAILDEAVLTAAVLDILADSGDPLTRNSTLMANLLTRVLAAGNQTPPALLAAMARSNATILEIPGVREQILAHIREFWIRDPQAAAAGLDEARILIDAGDLTAALRLLRKLEPLQEPADRAAFVQLYFSTMEAFAPQAPPLARNEMVTAAMAVLRSQGAHGAPLHFALSLLDAEVARLGDTPAGRESRARLDQLEQEFLTAHIAHFLAGHDSEVANLVRTLTRYGQREGYARGLRKVDEVLRADPSLLRVWLLRADWLVHLQRIDEAVASLQWLPKYVQDPPTLDALILLLGRAGILVHTGQELLQREGLLAASKVSLGIVQLRLGSYIAAARTLELAEPTPAGDHLYYRAMALIALGANETIEHGHRLLIQLNEEYPDSSLDASARTVRRMFVSDLGH